MQNSKTLYTSNEDSNDNALEYPINIKDDHQGALADVPDDSLNIDSIRQLKKDFSKKIQFVND